MVENKIVFIKNNRIIFQHLSNKPAQYQKQIINKKKHYKILLIKYQMIKVIKLQVYHNNQIIIIINKQYRILEIKFGLNKFNRVQLLEEIK